MFAESGVRRPAPGVDRVWPTAGRYRTRYPTSPTSRIAACQLNALSRQAIMVGRVSTSIRLAPAQCLPETEELRSL
jgi:hypothetical protein